MTFLLTDTFEDFFEVNGSAVMLNLAFDNVLRMFELFEDDSFTDFEKVDIALEILMENDFELIQDLSPEEKYELFLYVFKEFLGIDLKSKQVDSEGGETPAKLYDFKHDAGIIYASFLRAYQMDLFAQHGKLHWNKFIQLLTNLDDKSKFKEVLNIRQMKIPAPDKHNKEYRDYVTKMKRYYSLDQHVNEHDAVKALDSKWDALAESLKPRR